MNASAASALRTSTTHHHLLRQMSKEQITMTLLAPHPETDSAPVFTAVTYQRVSTKEQAAKGGRDEGFSIPAQREANARKAETLGPRDVAEVDGPGAAARAADRPEPQRMLEFSATHH